MVLFGLVENRFMESSIDRALLQGIEAQKTGNISLAEKYYSSILNTEPKHPHANHNMGLLKVQLGQVEQALPFFERALEAERTIDQFWFSYVDVLFMMGEAKNARSVLNLAKKKGVKNETLKKINNKIVNVEKYSSKKNTKMLHSERSPYAKIQNPSQVQIQSLINLYENGKYVKVIDKVQLLLKKFPQAVPLYNISGAAYTSLKKYNLAISYYKKALAIDPDAAFLYLRMTSIFKKIKKFDLAEESCRKFIKLKPGSAEGYYIMGNILNVRGELDSAIENFKKATQIKPHHAEAYFNLGNVFKAKGNLGGAKESFQRTIAINPHYSEAHYNMGNLFQISGDLNAAIRNYKKAIQIKPDYADAFSNLGIAFKKKGNLNEAMQSYVEAIRIKPSNRDFITNLMSLLTLFSNPLNSSQSIIKTHEELKKISLKISDGEVIDICKISSILSEASKILDTCEFNTATDISQIYRRNLKNLNCKRHMTIFNKHNIIPEFCFGCYKVQVEPRTVIELASLFIIFDRLQLKSNNTRKCLIEFRTNVSGFYKGLIYCSGIDEAQKVANYLDPLLSSHIRSDLKSKIKHGCSEYPLVFPLFREINMSGVQKMVYPEKWKSTEIEYDNADQSQISNQIYSTSNGLSLLDLSIMKNWFDYALGIGDKSIELLGIEANLNSDFYRIGQNRLQTYAYE